MKIKGQNGDTFEIMFNGEPFEGQLMALVVACCVHDGYEDIVVISNKDDTVCGLAFCDDTQVAGQMIHALETALPDKEVTLYARGNDDQITEQDTELN